uniref:Uncharacterized protein n=1 Tax=Parascaris univalens TaxID=6257 RepID=A0A915AS44_PARUN
MKRGTMLCDKLSFFTTRIGLRIYYTTYNILTYILRVSRQLATTQTTAEKHCETHNKCDLETSNLLVSYLSICDPELTKHILRHIVLCDWLDY